MLSEENSERDVTHNVFNKTASNVEPQRWDAVSDPKHSATCFSNYPSCLAKQIPKPTAIHANGTGARLSLQ